MNDDFKCCIIGVLAMGIASILIVTNSPSRQTRMGSKDTTSIATEVQGKDALVKYYITVGTSVRAYVDGNEVPLAYLQEQIEVKADGRLGPVTVRKMVGLNRTEINYVQELMK